jgi:hypothetical protein
MGNLRCLPPSAPTVDGLEQPAGGGLLCCGPAPLTLSRRPPLPNGERPLRRSRCTAEHRALLGGERAPWLGRPLGAARPPGAARTPARRCSEARALARPPARCCLASAARPTRRTPHAARRWSMDGEQAGEMRKEARRL